ncbi:hypothetical protein A5651_19725 [Mycobacterium sp. 1274761.0]|nr:hypothetical protein A5651_19725 [Mycobacterium sp. 1274761.0]
MEDNNEIRPDRDYQVVAVVLVPLSQVILPFQSRNCGAARTIVRSYSQLAGSAKGCHSLVPGPCE